VIFKATVESGKDLSTQSGKLGFFWKYVDKLVLRMIWQRFQALLSSFCMVQHYLHNKLGRAELSRVNETLCATTNLPLSDRRIKHSREA
jgi:hypothetical protein